MNFIVLSATESIRTAKRWSFCGLNVDIKIYLDLSLGRQLENCRNPKISKLFQRFKSTDLVADIKVKSDHKNACDLSDLPVFVSKSQS